MKRIAALLIMLSAPCFAGQGGWEILQINTNTSAWNLPGPTNTLVSTNYQGPVNLHDLKVDGNNVSTSTAAAFDGGTIHLNTTLGNANPKLALTNGSQAAFLSLSNGQFLVGYRESFVVTNTATFTNMTGAVMEYHFEATNATEPVVNDWSASLGGTNDGWVTVGSATQPTWTSITNSPQQTYCYSFDSGDYMYATNESVFDFSTNTQFTMSFWCKSANYGPGATLLAKALNTSPYTGWYITQDTSKLGILLLGTGGGVNGIQMFTVDNAPVNVWLNIVGVNRAAWLGDLEIWTNGVRAALTVVASNITADVLNNAPVMLNARGLPGAVGYQGAQSIFLPVVATGAWSAAYITNRYQMTNPTNYLDVIPPGQTWNTTNTTERTMIKMVNSLVSGRAPYMLMENIPLGPVGDAGTLYTNSSGALYVK